MDELPLGALLGAFVALLVVAAFFNVSETSMMALNRYRLKHLVKQGHRGARLTSRLLAQTNKLLGVILLGNTIVIAASSTLVTFITIRFIGRDELSLTIAALVVSFLILVFAEITPKIVAATHPEHIAYPASYVLTPLIKLFGPVLWVVNLFVRPLLWLFRLTPESSNVTQKLSLEEIRSLVLEAGHFVPQKTKTTLVNLLDLEKITVDDVMVSRNEIEAIDLDAEPEVIRNQLATCYHTRLPVYQSKLDEIAGIVHVRTVLNRMRDEQITADGLREVMREPYFIPSGTPLFSQLQHFQENQQRIGLVVDEYGELMGLVTLEDILEEIIGEFTTASPVQPGAFVREVDGSVLVEGSSLLRDLNRKLGFKFPLDGPKTLNGLILEHFQDIPEAGTSLKIADYPLEIVQTQDRVVKVVRVFKRLEDKPPER